MGMSNVGCARMLRIALSVLNNGIIQSTCSLNENIQLTHFIINISMTHIK